MGRTIPFIILLCALAGSHAQEGWQLGVDAGVRTTKARNNLVSDEKRGYGYAAGVSARYDATKIFWYELSALYENNSSKEYGQLVIDDNGSYLADISYNQSYLTVPVYAGVRAGRKVQFSAGVGGFASYLLQAEVTASANGQRAFSITSLERAKRFDAGIGGQAAVTFHTDGPFSFSLKANHHIGLVNQMKFDYGYGQVITTTTSRLLITIALKV